MSTNFKSTLQKSQKELKNSPKIFNDSQLVEQIKKENAAKQSMSSQIDKTIQDREFTQAEVEQQWKVFFNNQGEKGLPLLHVKVKVEEKSKIKLNLTNRNREFFKPFKERLTRFFRNRLQNTTLTFEIIQENKTNQNPNSAPLSNVEKFIFLTKKYPILKMLKERFGLEVEN